MNPYSTIPKYPAAALAATLAIFAGLMLASPADAATDGRGKHCSDVWCRSADALDPTPTVYTLRNDFRTICASVLLDWSDLKVTRNDTIPGGTKITDMGTPANGEVRLVADDGTNHLEYRDPNANGTYWVYYEVHFPNGTSDHAFWQVRADRSC